MLIETFEKLMQWEISLGGEITETAIEGDDRATAVAKDVSICVNFVALGIGRLSFSASVLKWTGTLPSFSESADSAVKSHIQLQWDVSCLGDIRVKTVDVDALAQEEDNKSNEMLLMKVGGIGRGSDPLFLQFQCREPKDVLVFWDALSLAKRRDVGLTIVDDSTEIAISPIPQQPQSSIEEVDRTRIKLEYDEKKAILQQKRDAALKRVQEEYEASVELLDIQLQLDLDAVKLKMLSCESVLDNNSESTVANVAACESTESAVKECGICCDEREYY
ncbi:UNVERIFIED_CONTAM: hypothetical protein HDU68_005962, partial [Siphonaria sp. JEL0065]